MLESMAVGCCMVASATPPVQEALQDGVTGALVDYFDGQALIDRICELLEDPETRARYGAAARDHVLRHYDLETVCLPQRSEEHTSELQSLMRISYAVFCLKK